jgi:hypothetical protein
VLVKPQFSVFINSVELSSKRFTSPLYAELNSRGQPFPEIMSSEYAALSECLNKIYSLVRCAVSVSQVLLDDYVRRFEPAKSTNHLLALELKAISYGCSCVALRVGLMDSVCPSIIPSPWTTICGLIYQCMSYQSSIRDQLQPLLVEVCEVGKLSLSQQHIIEKLIQERLVPLSRRLWCLISLLFYSDGEDFYTPAIMHSNLNQELRQFRVSDESPTTTEVIQYFRTWSRDTPRLAALEPGLCGTKEVQSDRTIQANNVIERYYNICAGQEVRPYSSRDGPRSSAILHGMNRMVTYTANDMEGEIAHSSIKYSLTDRKKREERGKKKFSSRRCGGCSGRLGKVEAVCDGAIMHQACTKCFESYNLRLRDVWDLSDGSKLVLRETEVWSQSALESRYQHYQDAELTREGPMWRWDTFRNKIPVTLYGPGPTAAALITDSAATSPWSETDAAPPPYMLPSTPLRQACAIYAAANRRRQKPAPMADCT